MLKILPLNFSSFIQRTLSWKARVVMNQKQRELNQKFKHKRKRNSVKMYCALVNKCSSNDNDILTACSTISILNKSSLFLLKTLSSTLLTRLRIKPAKFLKSFLPPSLFRHCYRSKGIKRLYQSQKTVSFFRLNLLECKTLLWIISTAALTTAFISELEKN